MVRIEIPQEKQMAEITELGRVAYEAYSAYVVGGCGGFPTWESIPEFQQRATSYAAAQVVKFALSGADDPGDENNKHE